MNVPQWYLSTPAGKVMLAELDSAREVERLNLLERLQTLDDERAKSAPVLAKKLADARAKMQAAQEALAKATVSYNLATAACYGAMVSHDHQRGALVAKLRTLRPEVDAFVKGMKALLDDKATREVMSESVLMVDGKYRTKTNMESQSRRTHAIANAIKDAEALVTSDVEDLTEILQAIRDGIPPFRAPNEEAVAV